MLSKHNSIQRDQLDYFGSTGASEPFEAKVNRLLLLLPIVPVND
ncbi:hypothetical protein [Peribacillus sp. NPDC096540]